MKKRILARLLATVALVLLSVGVASGTSADELTPAEDAATATADDAALTGREIYQRVLANRHDAVFQKQQLVSRDAGGSTYQTELWTRWKDGHDENGEIKRNVLSKTIAKYTKPNNVRGVGYLVVLKENAPNDQFVYFPSARRVRRTRIDESIMGTDFTIEDIVPRELETADYERAPDEVVDGAPCFVVVLIPKSDSDSQYSKLLVSIEKQHYVPIQTRYWNLDGVEVKRQSAPVSEIEELEGVWLTRRVTMANLLEDSATTLHVLEMEPNAKIKDSLFTVRTLEQKSR